MTALLDNISIIIPPWKRNDKKDTFIILWKRSRLQLLICRLNPWKNELMEFISDTIQCTRLKVDNLGKNTRRLYIFTAKHRRIYSATTLNATKNSRTININNSQQCLSITSYKLNYNSKNIVPSWLTHANLWVLCQI